MRRGCHTGATPGRGDMNLTMPEHGVRGAGAFKTERWALLYELGQAFSAMMAPDELLPSIIAKTKDVLRAEGGALLLLDDARQELYFPVASDLTPAVEARLRQVRVPADRGVAGWVLRHGTPARVAEAARDARFYTGVDRHTG